MISWFSILLVICSFMLIIQLLRNFPSKQTPKYVYIFVFIGWWLPFVSIALIPFDVYCALSGQDQSSLLYVSWDVLYWVTFSFCWVIMPLLKNFMTAGEFTFWTKVLSALMVRLRYLLVLLSLFIAFIIYLAVIQNLDKQTMSAFLAAMGNFWGLFLIIILMGYGVVAIPRIWWYKGEYKKSLNYFYLKAVQLDEKRIDAAYDLDQLILKAIAFEKETRYDPKLHGYAQRVIERCPTDELEVNRNRTYNLPEAERPTLKALVSLNTNLKNLKSERVRLECRWEQLLAQTFAIQDILDNQNNQEKYIRSFFWPQKTGRAARFREVVEWWWYSKCYPIFTKVLVAFFALFSILVILGESTLFIDTSVGLFPIFFKDDHGDVGTQILCFIPMIYLFSTAYIGLFTLRIPGSYGLYNKNHTDPANLVWSAFFTSRLVQPLIYNYLLFIKVTGTEFQKVMGVMDLVPFLGNEFSKYFPIVIVGFAILNAFDFYTWIMVKLGIPQLSFADNFDKGKLDEGIVLVRKGKGYSARQAKEKGYEHKPVVPQSYNTKDSRDSRDSRDSKDKKDKQDIKEKKDTRSKPTPQSTSEHERSISMSKNSGSRYEDLKRRIASPRNDSLKTPLRS